MQFKKFTVSALLLSGILLAGCSDKEEAKEPADSETPKTEVTETAPIEEKQPTEPTETDKEADPNSENNATAIYHTFFDGIEEENLEKIRSVYQDEATIKGYEDLFTTFDIATTIEKYEVISQNGTIWDFDIAVKFIDQSTEEGFTDNISNFEIRVDTKTGEIVTLAIVGTQELTAAE